MERIKLRVMAEDAKRVAAQIENHHGFRQQTWLRCWLR
jgi:hypothetical protein